MPVILEMPCAFSLTKHPEVSRRIKMAFCNRCDRAFSSEEALQQHLRDSPAHAVSYDCDECDRAFSSEKAFQQHLRDAPAHRHSSPLDTFFFNYPSFDYDPKATPSDEMTRLRRCYGWRRDDPEGSDAWDSYRKALVLEFQNWYGTNDEDLVVWRSLCRALRVYPLPQTCAGCRQVRLHSRYWNDLC